MRQIFQYHPVVGYTFVPEVHARIPHETGGYPVRANPTGFRCDREFKRERASGMRRVLLFGDSFTAGDGVGHRRNVTGRASTDVGHDATRGATAERFPALPTSHWQGETED